MYYIQRVEILIIMLGGGDKSSQSKDIALGCVEGALLISGTCFYI